MEDITNEDNFSPYKLGTEERLPQWAEEIVSNLAGCSEVVASLAAKTPLGSLHAKDVAQCRKTASLFEVQLIIRTRRGGTADRYWSLVRPFRPSPVGPHRWLAEKADPCIVEVRDLTAPLCFLMADGFIII